MKKNVLLTFFAICVSGKLEKTPVEIVEELTRGEGFSNRKRSYMGILVIVQTIGYIKFNIKRVG